MKFHSGKSFRTALSLLLMVLCTVGLLADRWYRDYEKAMQAVKSNDWQQAVRLLQESLKKRDRPRQQARTVGLEFIDYFPYYYLGLAYFKLDRYAEAEDALEKSRLYAESLKVPALARELSDMLAHSRERLAAARSAMEQPAVENNQARPVAVESAEKKEEEKPPLADSLRPEPEQPPRDQRKNEVQQSPVQTGGAAPGKSDKPADLLEKTVLELKKDVRDRVREQDFAGAERQLEILRQIDSGRNWALAGLEKIRLARSALQVNQGIRLYFEGDLEGAERLLLEVITQGEVSSTVLARAHQFMAAVFAERHLREPEGSGKFLSEMQGHLRRAASADPESVFSPDRRFFSPELIRLIKEE